MTEEHLDALTLYRPWGQLIIGRWGDDRPLKDVENRTWGRGQWPQPLLIHAGKTLDPYLNKSGRVCGHRVCGHRASNFLTPSTSSEGALWGRRTSLTV